MKMKKKILSAAVVAALGAGSAQAVYLGTDGTGQVLFFPYYTVQGNEETLLTVVNTRNEGKAVKIRFREAENSREVLDFNIYLSPYDVWVGKIADNDAGTGAAVVSPDKTCTVPLAISQGSKIDFRSLAYAGGAANPPPGPNPDSGTQDLSRTMEGYVEIIEMGVANTAGIVAGTATTWDQNADGVADYKHSGGVPNNCAGIANNFAGVWAGAPGTDVLAPTGGIFGELAVINVAKGTEISENATALEQVYTTQQHVSTGTELPTISQASPNSVVLYNGAPVNDAWGVGEDAVSAVLMAASIANTYDINPAVEAGSAWITTFPTKWAYVANDQDGDGTVEGAPDDHAIEPFVSNFVGGKACERISVTAYDREEKPQQGQDLDFSPAPGVPGVNLCYEVNVIQFGDSAVMSSGSPITLKYSNLPGVHGWVNIGFAATTDGDGDGILDHTLVGSNNTFIGLPVIGFSATVLGNSNVGVGAAYGTSNSHIYLRNIQ